MGKGISFMEGLSEWHGKPPTPEQGQRALEELGTTYRDWTVRLMGDSDHG